MPPDPPEPLFAARDAMATCFEVMVSDADRARARAAADEALDEITRLDALLSAFRPDSEISQVNAEADRHPVRVRPEVFRLLQRAQRIGEESGAAFDVAVGAWMRCWGFRDSGSSEPSDRDLAAAHEAAGLRHVRLDAGSGTVSFDRPGVQLDLGAIGKGYAVECAVGILRAAGPAGGLVHGGTSTIQVVGTPPGASGRGWAVGVPTPATAIQSKTFPRVDPGGDPNSILAEVWLRDESLSLSAVWGRPRAGSGTWVSHVIDPRTGRPVRDTVMAVVVGPAATESDAWSTALLVGGVALQSRLERVHPEWRTLVVTRVGRSGRGSVRSVGMAVAHEEVTLDFDAG